VLGVLSCVTLTNGRTTNANVRPTQQEHGARFKISPVSSQMLQGPQLSLRTTDGRGNQEVWIYRHYAEFHPSLKATSVFGRYLGPGNDVGLNMSEPRELKPGQGTVMLRARTPNGKERHLAADLTQCVSAEWIKPAADSIEATYVLKNTDARCTLRRTATLVRFPQAPGRAIIREQFRLVRADKELEIIQFSQYIKPDDRIHVVSGSDAPVGLVLLCVDHGQPAPAFAQVLMGKGWRVGKPQQSGMDLAKKMRLVSRSLPKPRRKGIIAESYYVVATATDPERARAQLLSSARAVANRYTVGGKTK